MATLTWRQALKRATAHLVVILVFLGWTLLAMQIGFSMGQRDVLSRLVPMIVPQEGWQ